MNTPTTALFTARDLDSGQEVRWCPACGDYAILKQVKNVLPKLGYRQEEIVFISGIGCSSRFPYYLETYGIHSIHGRAPTLATGLKVTRPELSVWVITGDGDALAIGGNHFLHVLRRNPDINILLFNNQVYGLTKGQISPTSPPDQRTPTTPTGNIDHPLAPLSVALAAGATFVARTVDRFQHHMADVFMAAARHAGTSLVEIYQDCVVFNEGAFAHLTDKNRRDDTVLFLEADQPLIFGSETRYGIRLDCGTPRLTPLDEISTNDLWIHDPADPIKAQILAQFDDPTFQQFLGMELPTPVGVLYQRVRPTYEELVHRQLGRPYGPVTETAVERLLHAK